jgi:hypothetical protein
LIKRFAKPGRSCLLIRSLLGENFEVMRNLIKLLLIVTVVNAAEDHVEDGLTSTGRVKNQSNDN